MILRTFMLILLTHCAVDLFAQKDWELIRNREGIKVYRKDTDSSAYKSIMVEAVFDGSWEKLVRILKDINHHPDWVYKSVNSRLLKSANAYDITYYTVTQMPWPIEDRDVVINMKFKEDNVGKLHRIVTNSDPDELPKKAGLVRVPYFKAVWQVRALDKNRIAINYVVSVNPGGELPAWLVNAFAVKGPFETFRKLEQLLKE